MIHCLINNLALVLTWSLGFHEFRRNTSRGRPIKIERRRVEVGSRDRDFVLFESLNRPLEPLSALARLAAQ